MSSVWKGVQSVANAFSPSKKQRSVGITREFEAKSDSMQRGIKRKADPYDIDDDEVEGSSVSTPITRTRSRRNSEAPPSSAKSRQSTGKTKRQSVGKRLSTAARATPTSQLKIAALINGEDVEPSADARLVVADMSGSDSDLPRKQANTEKKRAEVKPVDDPLAAEKHAEDEPTTDIPVEGSAEKLSKEETKENNIHEVKALLKHKKSDQVSGRILLEVKWVDDSQTTWEPEEEIQDGASDMLFDYWKKQGGRGAALFQKGSKPLLKEQYWVYKILQHERNKSAFRFEVQWVGYPADSANTTWEPESKLKQVAKELLDEYWETHGGRDKFLTKRGKAKRAKLE